MQSPRSMFWLLVSDPPKNQKANSGSANHFWNPCKTRFSSYTTEMIFLKLKCRKRAFLDPWLFLVFLVERPEQLWPFSSIVIKIGQRCRLLEQTVFLITLSGVQNAIKTSKWTLRQKNIPLYKQDFFFGAHYDGFFNFGTIFEMINFCEEIWPPNKVSRILNFVFLCRYWLTVLLFQKSQLSIHYSLLDQHFCVFQMGHRFTNFCYVFLDSCMNFILYLDNCITVQTHKIQAKIV